MYSKSIPRLRQCLALQGSLIFKSFQGIKLETKLHEGGKARRETVPQMLETSLWCDAFVYEIRFLVCGFWVTALCGNTVKETHSYAKYPRKRGNEVRFSSKTAPSWVLRSLTGAASRRTAVVMETGEASSSALEQKLQAWEQRCTRSFAVCSGHPSSDLVHGTTKRKNKQVPLPPHPTHTQNNDIRDNKDILWSPIYLAKI